MPARKKPTKYSLDFKKAAMAYWRLHGFMELCRKYPTIKDYNFCRWRKQLQGKTQDEDTGFFVTKKAAINPALMVFKDV